MHQRVFDEVSIPIFDNIPGEVGLHQNVALVTINLTYSKETRVAPPDRITLKASPQSITFKSAVQLRVRTTSGRGESNLRYESC